jgi:hypothetical protein
MAGTFTIGGSSAGLLTGAKTVGPLTIVGAALVGQILDLTLASGDNTIAVPPGAIAVWIVPPLANAVALKVRTSLNSGDAGLPISASDPFGPWCWRGLAPASLIINAGGTVAGVELSFI